MQDSVNVLLEGVPPHMDLGALEQRINQLEGVKIVDDLHVWVIASGWTTALFSWRLRDILRPLVNTKPINHDQRRIKESKLVLGRCESLVRESKIKGKTVYFCEECGFGYADRKTAQECEAWCSTHKSCSLEITKKAIYVG